MQTTIAGDLQHLYLYTRVGTRIAQLTAASAVVPKRIPTVRTSKRIVVIAALGFAGALTLASTSSAQWGPYPYPYPSPYPYRYYNIDAGAAMRIEVTPHEAEVYLDGYYAGIVDDFNGAFQRLRARPGQHEIVLYLDGYRTVHQKLYLTPKNTIKVKYAMERLGAGEQPEARPEAPPPPPSPPPPQAGPPPPMSPPMPPPGMPGRGPATRRAPQGPPRGNASAYGTLAIRVQPIDADVLIDGELWHTQEAPDRLTIEVAEGPHTVEIRKAGYRPFVTQVQVRRGESTPLNVSLRTQEHQ